MEYGINLTAKPTSKFSEPINDLINSLISGDKGNALITLGEIEIVAVEKYTKISTHEYYADYLS